MLLLTLAFNVNAQISGIVFRDYNFNGTQETAGFPVEPGAYGIQVKAFNAAGTQLGTTKTTDAAGVYSFSVAEIASGTAVRIEFICPDGQFSAKRASTGTNPNGTNVQFVTAPSTVINYAVASQDWYSSSANPYTATNAFTNGNSEGVGSASTNNNLYVFPWNMGSGTPDDGGATLRLVNKGLGSIFGMTFQRTSRILLVSAYLKRHASFGPNGIGAIYKTDISTIGVPSAASLLVDVSAIGINVGASPRSVALPDNGSTTNTDLGVFANVGKAGIGGIDLTDDGKDLYLVNMFDKKLYRINVGAPLKASFAAADVTGSWTITDPAITGTTWRPMACKTANGRVYVGGVTVIEKTTAFNLTTDTVGMKAIVYEFDPATQAFTQVLNFPLSRRKGFSNADPRFPFRNNWWCGWQDNGGGAATDPLRSGYSGGNAIGDNNTAFSGGIYYPQPMFSDIEFDVDGSMVIGLRDRMGDQAGYANLMETNPTAGLTWRALCSGEMLRAGRNTGANTFAIENLGAVTTNGVTVTTTGLATSNPAVGGDWGNGGAAIASAGTPYGGNYGPGWGGTHATPPPNGPNPGTTGSYYYFNNNFNASPGIPAAAALNYGNVTFVAAHYNKTNGGLALLAGSNEVANTAMDPATSGFTQGVLKNYNKTSGTAGSPGNMSQRIQLVATTTTPTQDPLNMGKGNGLGNIELLNDAQPIEIGNRIWNDANGNGIQDPGEAIVGGVAIDLVSPGPDGIFGNGDDVVVASTTSNATTGEYYFNTLTTADARKPATWDGVGANDILPGFNYQIRIALAQASLTGLQPTRIDAGSNTFDNIDNDAIVSGTNAIVNFNTTDINHNFDFGFKPLASLGDRVWRDDNKDGIQDAGEPGVAGITVTLYNNAGAAISSTVTDAYGNYLFDNLTAGTYQVGFTLPTNYSFTTQTNNTDNTVLTGGSTAANGSDVNASGRTANVVLVAGENERNIDAGLIFTQPATNSIGDRVWFDSDGNGSQNGTEPGISGVTITLYASDGVTVIATTVTDANGNYIFTGLPASTNYIVGLTPPAGMLLTSSSGTTSGNATVNSDFSTTTFKTTVVNTGAAGTQITGIDAGLIQQAAAKASLGDKVWIDLSGGTANVQDANEPGLPGVTVELLDGTGASIDPDGAGPLTKTEMVTDAFGNYIFNNLNAGTYRVKFTLLSGYTFVTANTGTDDFKDSDANTGTGQTSNYTIVAGQRNLSIDAGVTQNTPAGTSKVGDFVWFDANGNGTQDAGETGVAGITVTLYNSGGTAIATTATDANGNYQFVNLAAATYSVGFSNLPAGYSFTSSTGTTSASGTTNSDANTATGKTSNFVLGAGQSLQGLDAGLIAGVSSGLGSIGNKVWWDIVTNNNVQDAGEPGVSGVTVNLYRDADGDGAITGAEATTPFATTTTNALGEYIFTGLAAGTYQVGYTNLPVGSSTVTQNSGTNDNIDSDGSTVTNATALSVSTTGLITLATGEDNLSVDLGIINAVKGSLGNRVWFDNGAGGGTANDGIQNGTEGGVAGVTVTLVNAAGQTVDRTGTVTATPVTTTTDANGYYAFADLTAGVSFAVIFSNPPAGFDFTTKAGTGGADDNRSDANLISGLTPAVAIVANTFNSTLDGGINSSRAALGNYVWLDTNGDGIQDATEAGVAGVTVSLYRPGFGPDGIAGNGDDALAVASMITDQNGLYFFANLIPGTYQAEFSTIPAGLSFTKQNTPGDNGDNTNSDAVPVTGNTSVGRTGNVVLIAGETDLTIDAGLFKPRAVIGNYVWADTNNNGLQDVGEPGLAGVLVTLIDVATGNPVAIAVADANGGYLFPNVAPGNYTLSFTNLPTGVTFTTSNVGGNDNIDSDVIGSTITGITVLTTTVNLSFDAGVVGAVILPARLVFTALKQGNTAKLIWTVTYEDNVLRYELEHSTDGINYTTINNQIRSGNSQYIYNDVQPSIGINYYRIKIVDIDGKVTYSEIRTVLFGKGGAIIIFPNPVTSSGKVNIQLPDTWQNKKIMIDVVNQSGQVVISQGRQQANQVETVDVSKLPDASYLLRISNENGEVEIRKIMVNR